MSQYQDPTQQDPRQFPHQQEGVYISTTSEVPGFVVESYLGVSFGITVRARGAGGQMCAGCQICFGGEITALAESSHEARNDCIHRLVMDALGKGANAVIGVRFDSNRSGRSGELLDIVAYGTAVRVRPK